MKKTRILSVVAVLCLLLGMFAGAAVAEETPELKKIGVAFMKNDPFMVPLYNGMKEVCDANGIELIEYYAENDIEKQISQCDDLLQQDIDGLIVMPVDFEGIAYIASDNYQAGWLCGEHVLETLDSAKILVLSHPEIKCTIDRLQGFKDALEGHEGYEIISEQPCSGLYDKGMTIMDNWLQQYTDFNVVFAINDGSLQGAIASMQAANRLEGVQSYAIDGQQQMADYILEGKQTAEAAQDPYSMGKGAVELLIKHFNGEPYEYENLLEVTLITKDNAADYVGF